MPSPLAPRAAADIVAVLTAPPAKSHTLKPPVSATPVKYSDTPALAALNVWSADTAATFSPEPDGVFPPGFTTGAFFGRSNFLVRFGPRSALPLKADVKNFFAPRKKCSNTEFRAPAAPFRNKSFTSIPRGLRPGAADTIRIRRD
ncbi:hypothetical protein, partial [Streptomyces violaceorubidus]|uniref:hypothetical protein n=1 Tax=Streptomyces violaceorubidus TaxID=284042 RepID=UPI001AE07A40